MAGRYKPYPEYKDSGVEWLEEIPSHWSACQLKFLSSCNDEVLSDSLNSEYEIEYVDIGSVSAIDGIQKTETMLLGRAPSRARRIVRDGDVIVSTVRTYLEAIASIDFPPENLVVSTGFAVIRPGRFLHKRFAAYCLRAKGFIKEVVARSVGVSYPAINASDLIDIKVPAPIFKEQGAIANFLDHETAKIDTLIEKQQQLIQLLKEKRQAVISHAVTKGLNSKARMRNSGVEWLGEVPEHWDVWKLCHFAPIITCGVAVTPDYVDDGVVFLSAQNIKKWRIDLSKGHKYISRKSHAELTKNRIPVNGDILLSRVGTIGEACIVDVDFEFSIFVSLTHLRLNSAICINEFFIYLCESQYVRSMHGAVTLVGGGVGNLNVNDLRIYKLVMPSLNEQQEIVKFISGQVSRIDRLIDEAGKAVALMQERRTALISAAVTGKIDVRDWVAPPASPTHKEVAA